MSANVLFKPHFFSSVIWTEQTVRTQMEKYLVVCQHSPDWYTRAEEKWSMRMRQAATDKRITPLLSTPGAVTPEHRNTVKKKGQDLDFFSPSSWQTHNVGVTTWHTIPVCTEADMILARAWKQHPKVWPCSPDQPPFNLPPETADGWTWYVAQNLRLSVVSTTREFAPGITQLQCYCVYALYTVLFYLF